MAIIGIAIAPTRRSTMAMLESTMFECFCSSFLCFTAMITNALKIMVMSEVINMISAEIKGNVERWKSHETRVREDNKILIYLNC